MKATKSRHLYAAWLLCALFPTLIGCTARADGSYYYENHSFSDFDISALTEGKEAPRTIDAASLIFDPLSESAPIASVEAEKESYHRATVQEKALPVYISPSDTSRVVITLPVGDTLEAAYYSADYWQVKKEDVFLGYCRAGALSDITWDNYYAYLPEESGMAPNAAGELVPAKSKLVDVRRYTDQFVIKMKLAKDGTSIGEPFYNRNLCLLQYDTLQKLIKAAELFAKDGYRIVIYDAYRPTSVQQRWFDVIRVHKWVADPKIGMGGIHDRGVAVDMTLMDKNGIEMDMPTAMHTLTEASSRKAAMTDTQRANVKYMTDIMVQCGFTYINSEWWHFQDSRIAEYLPTDHPIDEIPMIYSEEAMP